MSEEKAKRIEKILLEGPNTVLKGNRAWYDVGGKNYQVEFPTKTSTVVGIIDKTSNVAQVTQATKVAKAQVHVAQTVRFLEKSTATGNVANIQKATKMVSDAEKALRKARIAPPKANWVVRLDTPHKGAKFNHININPDLVNAGKAVGKNKFVDPHLPLPPGGIEAGTGVAKFAQVMNKVNKVAIPLAIAIDTVRTGIAVASDIKKGTTRNTVSTVANVAGGWAGGYGGATGGAAIGTAFLPGLGTIIGGILGALTGGIGGSVYAGVLIDTIGDDCNYDMLEIKCENCGIHFKARVYLGETKCTKCREICLSIE